MTWTDTTSYSRSESDRVPRTWTLHCNAHGFVWTVTVTRHRDYADTAWLLTCPSIDFQHKQLRSAKLADAQTEALGLVRERLGSMFVSLADATQK